jgi:lipopolysaccharide export system permease protein
VNLLDRHIFKNVLLTCVGTIALFTFILVLGNLVKDLLGFVLTGQLGTVTFARLVLLLVPFVISYALPMGMLTGILLTLGRLSADSEITAMRAAGLGFLRIARPLLLLAGLGAAADLYVNFSSLPWSRVEYHRLLGEAVRADPLRLIVPKTFVRDFPGVVVYVGDKAGEVLSDVWVWKLDKNGRVVWFARGESGHVSYEEDTNELLVTLTPAVIEQRSEKNPEDFVNTAPIVATSAVSNLRFSLDRVFGRQFTHQQKIEWMTLGELRAEEQRRAAQPYAAAEAGEHARALMEVALTRQDKINTALAVLSFALIGVPLGIKVSRRETSANLGIALAVVLGYYFLTVMVKWLDRHPEYRPDVLIWMPNLVLVAFAVWLFRRVDK